MERPRPLPNRYGRNAGHHVLRLALLVNDPFQPDGYKGVYWLDLFSDELADRHNALWNEARRLQLRSDLLLKGVEPVGVLPTLGQGVRDEPK